MTIAQSSTRYDEVSASRTPARRSRNPPVSARMIARKTRPRQKRSTARAQAGGDGVLVSPLRDTSGQRSFHDAADSSTAAAADRCRVNTAATLKGSPYMRRRTWDGWILLKWVE